MMKDLSTEEGGGSLIDRDEEERIERTLKKLTCVRADEALIRRLTAACDEESENVGLRRETVSSMRRMEPVTVDDARISKWAGMMDSAARMGTEKQLERLAPGKMHEFSKMRCSVAMDLASVSDSGESGETSAHTAHRAGGSAGKRALLSYRFYGIAAALLLVSVSLALVFHDGVDEKGAALAENSSAELNRQAVRVVEQGVNWNDEQGEAQREYQVDFEDSVEVTDGKGRRVLISVPKSRKVVVPVEVY